MVNLSPKIREFMERRIKSLAEARDLKAFKSTLEVETELVEDITTVGRAGDFSWTADFKPWEPKAARGPSPLAYFISAMGLCHQSHYAEEAALMGVRLNSVKIRIRASYDLRPGVGFEAISYETHIGSPESEERIRRLVERAESGCYVTNTLKRALKITGKIYLNGRELMARSHP